MMGDEVLSTRARSARPQAGPQPATRTPRRTRTASHAAQAVEKTMAWAPSPGAPMVSMQKRSLKPEAYYARAGLC